jgi:hypothetical protein
MKKIIIANFLAVLASIAYGQGWRKIITDFYNEPSVYAWGSGIVVVKDTLFVHAVFNYSNNDSVQLNIIKIEPINGDVFQNFRLLDPNYSNSGCAVVRSYTNGAGSNLLEHYSDSEIWLNSFYWNTNDGNRLNTLICLSGDFTTTRVDTLAGLGGDIWLSYGANRRLFEGGRIVYGYRTPYEQSTTAEGIISKLDSDFTQKWVKSIPNCAGVAHAVETPDRGFLLAFMNQTGYNNNVDFKSIVRLDSLGNIIWRDDFGGYSEATDFGITVSSSGEMIVAFDKTANGLNSIPRYLIIRKIQDTPQPGFETVYERQHLLFRANLQISSIQEMPNGDYMIWGQVSSLAGANLTFNSQGYVTDSDQPLLRGFLFRVSADFDSLWCRTYFQPDTIEHPMYANRFIIKDIDFDSQGNIYTAGEGNYTKNQRMYQKLWVMKVDEYGCLEPGCQFVDVDEVVVGYEQSMTVYPNPTQGLTTIQFSIGNPAALSGNFSETKLIVTDMQGRRVMEKKMPSLGSNYQTTIDLSGEPAGLYYVQWVSGSSWLDQVSVVKE